jgi:hypothetical protein
MDVKGEGGYVVAAPSVHETGAVYRMRSPELRVMTVNSKSVEERIATVEREWPIVQAILPHYTEGRRHEVVLGLAAWLRREGYSSDRASQFMQGLGRAAEDPEGGDRAKAVEDTFRKPAAEISVGALGSGLLTALDPFRAPIPEPEVPPEVLDMTLEEAVAHLKIVLDHPDPFFHASLILGAAQDHMIELLHTVFYVIFSGGPDTDTRRNRAGWRDRAVLAGYARRWTGRRDLRV